MNYIIYVASSEKYKRSDMFVDTYDYLEQAQVCQGIGNAEHIAKYLAAKNPGKEVCINRAISIFVAEKPKVNKAIINEKGEVLPE